MNDDIDIFVRCNNANVVKKIREIPAESCKTVDHLVVEDVAER